MNAEVVTCWCNFTREASLSRCRKRIVLITSSSISKYARTIFFYHYYSKQFEIKYRGAGKKGEIRMWKWLEIETCPIRNGGGGTLIFIIKLCNFIVSSFRLVSNKHFKSSRQYSKISWWEIMRIFVAQNRFHTNIWGSCDWRELNATFFHQIVTDNFTHKNNSLENFRNGKRKALSERRSLNI